MGTVLTSIHIDSVAGIFTAKPALNLGGTLDKHDDALIFKATFGSSFGSLSFGNVAQPGPSQDFVASDLSAVGTLSGGGHLGEVDRVYFPVPEPTTIVLLCTALALFGSCRLPTRMDAGLSQTSHNRGLMVFCLCTPPGLASFLWGTPHSASALMEANTARRTRPDGLSADANCADHWRQPASV